MRRSFELNGDVEYADNGMYDRFDDYTSAEKKVRRGNLVNRREPAALRLDEIDVSATEWQTDAACRGMDVEMFFAEDAGSRLMAALICEDCPVRALCFEFAETNKERGTWGGKFRGART
jgi:hypothetical protein